MKEVTVNIESVERDFRLYQQDFTFSSSSSASSYLVLSLSSFTHHLILYRSTTTTTTSNKGVKINEFQISGE